MREFDLLYEIDPSLLFLRLEAIPYDNYESSFPLKSNVVVMHLDQPKGGV